MQRRGLRQNQRRPKAAACGPYRGRYRTVHGGRISCSVGRPHPGPSLRVPRQPEDTCLPPRERVPPAPPTLCLEFDIIAIYPAQSTASRLDSPALQPCHPPHQESHLRPWIETAAWNNALSSSDRPDPVGGMVPEVGARGRTNPRRQALPLCTRSNQVGRGDGPKGWPDGVAVQRPVIVTGPGSLLLGP